MRALQKSADKEKEEEGKGKGEDKKERMEENGITQDARAHAFLDLRLSNRNRFN